MIFVTGGPIFWILVALALTALFVFFERLIELRRAQIDWQDFINGVKNVLDTGHEDEALAICDDTAVPVAAVMATAIRYRNRAPRTLRDTVEAQKRAEISRLDRRLAALAIMGHVAPMIGLLGTIFGFAKTILLVNGNEIVSRAALMSNAMDAVVSAGLGLAIAIPITIMYGSLRLRMERLVSGLEAATTIILSDVTKKEPAK